MREEPLTDNDVARAQSRQLCHGAALPYEKRSAPHEQGLRQDQGRQGTDEHEHALEQVP